MRPDALIEVQPYLDDFNGIVASSTAAFLLLLNIQTFLEHADQSKCQEQVDPTGELSYNFTQCSSEGVRHLRWNYR